jgi:hypothetical protein
LPEASFCFDIAHARQVDPTMREAALMMEHFSDRLTQIHISSVTSESLHEPLDAESIVSYKRISKLIPPSIPIIIESPMPKNCMELEIKKVRLIFEDDLFQSYINSIGTHLSSYSQYYMNEPSIHDSAQQSV